MARHSFFIAHELAPRPLFDISWQSIEIISGQNAAVLIVCAVVPLGAMLAAPLESRFQGPAAPEDITGIVVLAGADNASLTLDTMATENP